MNMYERTCQVDSDCQKCLRIDKDYCTVHLCQYNTVRDVKFGCLTWSERSSHSKHNTFCLRKDVCYYFRGAGT